MAQKPTTTDAKDDIHRDGSSGNEKKDIKPGGFQDIVIQGRRNPWVVGTFGVSSLLAGLHLGKASCGDGRNRSDCALGAFYTGIMGFSGAMLMMQDMPDPDDPGTPEKQSTGGDP